MQRVLGRGFAFVLVVFLLAPYLDAQTSNSDREAQPRSPTATVSGIEHVIWVWFENRDSTAITPQTAPYFTSFAATYANLTNFNGVSHPSQPNYLDAFSGSNQGITGDGYCTFPASTDNLAKQLAVAGKSWRVFAQDYPGNCSDLQTSAGGVDGPGVAGTYVRKHNPAMGFESVRLDPVQCANIQALADFDPTINFALVVPNLTNDMHDGTTAQGDTFLQAFVPLVTASPDWEHTLLIVTFDEGSPGNHIYTAAGAPWLSHLTIATSLNHFNVLRTIEEVFGLPYLGSAATATTITELLPSGTTPTPTPAPTATATPTSTPVPTLTPTPTPTSTPASTSTPAPTPAITPTPTPTPAGTPVSTPTPPAARAINISTRMRVQAGDNVGIGGFIIAGNAPKHVLLRAIGPSLIGSGVPNALADPVLELQGPGAFLTVTDDNWKDDPEQETAIVASGIPPTNDLESAIDALLPPGAYTAIVSGKNDTAGVALIEVYDLSVPAGLANISTRAFVSTGDNIVIAGFVLGENIGNDGIIVRGIGPSLTALGVPNALPDPTLELRDGNGVLLIADNDWQDDSAQAGEVTAAGLAPINPLESAIAVTLSPGAYTALLGGLDNATGVGVVEVYDRSALESSSVMSSWPSVH